MGIVNPEMLSIYDEIQKICWNALKMYSEERRCYERLLDFAENEKSNEKAIQECVQERFRND
jgi:cobalamin-dependent methionine synthase I